MKRLLLPSIVLLGLAGLGIYIILNLRDSGQVNTGLPDTIDKGENSLTMQITSPAFAQDRLIQARYTCKGDNINPALMFKGVPPAAKSLALIVHDPDATGKDWVHWTLWNIRPDVDQIPEGSTPLGAVEGITDFGRPGYGGPCPPSGTHRYFFELYALDTELDLPATTTGDKLAKAIEGHTLAKAELIGLFTKD